MKTNAPPPPKVVLRAPQTALAWLVLAKAIVDGLTKNKGTFATPDPPLAQLSSDVTALDTAQTATHTRTVGVIGARDAALAVVRKDLRRVCAYVQGLVDAAPDDAVTLAQGAGLALRRKNVPTKSELSAKPNKTTSGSVDLVARLGNVKAAHEWAYSTDGGRTWTSAQTTLQAKTTISGLVPATTVLFRHRAVTKTGPDLWSQPVSMIVV
jgi:hypothetical protein